MNLKNLFVISSILSLLNVAQGAFQIKEEAKKYIDITHDGKTVARVMTAYDESTPESKHETYKVYTHIFDKHGKAPITKGAEERLLITGEYFLDGRKPDFQERAWILGI